MKNFKLILALLFAICFIELKAQSTDFEKIAVGGTAEFTKWNLSKQSPLIIVNGIELRKKNSIFNKIDLNDIEKFDIIKDKMAIEKYGEKAIDGVIMVTIKKGKYKKYKKLLKSNAYTHEGIAPSIFDKKQYKIVISGVVKGEINQTIPEVVVTNLTKKEVYYSDSQGNYKVNVAKSDFINFWKEGYESQKIMVRNDSIINIALKVQTSPKEIMIK